MSHLNAFAIVRSRNTTNGALHERKPRADTTQMRNFQKKKKKKNKKTKKIQKKKRKKRKKREKKIGFFTQLRRCQPRVVAQKESESGQ
jgi:hypothetical protein